VLAFGELFQQFAFPGEKPTSRLILSPSVLSSTTELLCFAAYSVVFRIVPSTANGAIGEPKSKAMKHLLAEALDSILAVQSTLTTTPELIAILTIEGPGGSRVILSTRPILGSCHCDWVPGPELLQIIE
jgi:hypothetical protein